jgi:ferric-dicitrate binding protein FerR (iron transport regulator)
MNHPNLERLTAWVHDLLEPVDARETADHLAACADCRGDADHLRDEARAIAAEIAPDARLAALKERLLRETPAARRPRSAGLFWQASLAAAVLFGLVAVLLSPGPHHRLTAGRVALEDGREVSAPLDLAASKSWRLRAIEKSSVRLSDRSTVELGAGSRFGLEGTGERGVQAELSTGEAVFVVAPDPRRLVVRAPAGRVESGNGTFSVKIVDSEEGGTPMKGLIAGALVTVFAGSASLSNAQGQVPAEPGHPVVLAAFEAPLLVASPQDAEALLKRLEQLAARVAKLEDELTRLETRNKQLKDQLKAGGGAFGWSAGNPGGGGLRVIQGAPGAAPGQPVIIELEEKLNELRIEQRKEK